MSSDGIELRLFRDGDETTINDCFNQAFKTDRSLEEWAFRFRSVGSPRKIVVACRGAEVLASVGGVATRMLVGGEAVDALAVVDAFALAGPAGEDQRRSLLDQSLDFFVDQFGSSVGCPLIFVRGGSAAAFELGTDSRGERQGLSVVTTLRRTAPNRRTPRSLCYRAEAGRDWEPRLDDLWKRIQREDLTSVVRDTDFALRRFAGSPAAAYHFFLVFPRFSRRAVAYAVFTLDEECCRWADFVWDHGHPGALDLLTHVSSRLAAQSGVGCERVTLGGDESGLVRLQARGFETEGRRDDLSLQILFRDPSIIPRSFPEGHALTAVDLEAI